MGRKHYTPEQIIKHLREAEERASGENRPAYRSHWLQRTLVPGQINFDNGRTALYYGEYGDAALYFGAMLGEQVLAVLTLGQGKAIQQSASSARLHIKSNWFRYERWGEWMNKGVNQTVDISTLIPFLVAIGL